MRDAQYNSPSSPVPSTCITCLSSTLFLTLFLLLSLLALSFRSPLSLFASAPPYNHAGSWLSFGVVYIAVIVRVQYGDWAEHVYSLTRLFCNKSQHAERRGLEGEEEWERRGERGYVHQHLHTHRGTFSVKKHSNKHIKKLIILYKHIRKALC